MKQTQKVSEKAAEPSSWWVIHIFEKFTSRSKRLYESSVPGEEDIL